MDGFRKIFLTVALLDHLDNMGVKRVTLQKPDVFSEKVYHKKVKYGLSKKHETTIPWQGGELNTETLTTNPLIHTAGLTTL